MRKIIEKTELSEIYDGLEQIQSIQRCNDCAMDCPYYISGNYGKECALDIVMTQIGIEIQNA